MENYASYKDSRAVLERLGFKPLYDKEDEVVFDSPNEDWFGPVIQIRLYQCRDDYWCADLDGGYMAPIVWNGPKADWDKSDTTEEFVSWLNKHFPSWR